eukprot:4341674-Pleurochrysis_carterae.AAC.1
MIEPLPSYPNIDKIGVRSSPAVGVRDYHRREQAHYPAPHTTCMCKAKRSGWQRQWRSIDNAIALQTCVPPAKRRAGAARLAAGPAPRPSRALVFCRACRARRLAQLIWVNLLHGHELLVVGRWRAELLK